MPLTEEQTFDLKKARALMREVHGDLTEGIELAGKYQRALARLDHINGNLLGAITDAEIEEHYAAAAADLPIVVEGFDALKAIGEKLVAIDTPERRALVEGLRDEAELRVTRPEAGT